MNQQIPFLEELKQDLLEHAPPTETGRRLLRNRLRLRGAWAAAAAFMVVLAIGGLTWIVGGDVAPTTTVDETITEPGPELTWQQVTAPKGVSTVRDLWSYSEGFAIWTGEEIWTSPDAENWELVASEPPTADTNFENVVTHADDLWLVAGADDNGAPITATTRDGSTWTTSPLPASSPTNDLLTSTVVSVSVASGPNGFVAVGAVATQVDQQAILERYAPELSNGEVRTGDDSIDIVDSDGVVRVSVPYEEIDERLAAHRGVILDTTIWHSPDAESWNQVDVIEDAGPRYVRADSDRYALTLARRTLPEQEASPGTPVLTSTNGVDWDVLTELQDPGAVPAPLGIPAFFGIVEQDLIVTGQDTSLLRISPDGTSQLVSTGPAFEGTDLQDLTIAQVVTGDYGVVAAAYNRSTGDTPYQALWYSPDGQRWNRQDTNDIFGSDVNLQAAVGSDQVVVAAEAEGEAGLALNAPFDLWIGTIGN